MTEHSFQPYSVAISETIGEFTKVNLDPDHKEMFVIGYEGLAVMTLASQILATRALPISTTIIGPQRTAGGWQYLSSEG